MIAEATGTRADSLPDRSDLPPTGSRIHMVGIGGAGMRGLALLLEEAGYRVDGCDRAGAPDAQELTGRGVGLSGEHAAEHVEGAGLVVRSSAVPEEHPEIAEARRHGIPVMKRARALGALLNGRRLLAISGTHGKTTITAMAGHALRAAGVRPAVAVGGKVDALDGYAAPGDGSVAVVEADEYDRSFLELDPHLLVVSSLEPEHVESYGTFQSVLSAYRELADRASPRDGVLFCVDDPGASGLGAGVENAAGYGRGEEAAYRLEDGPDPGGPHRLSTPEGEVEFGLLVPGAHNRENAAAALAAAHRLGVALDELGRALSEFRGVERRLQLLHQAPRLTVVDDYAHHPSEVEASLSALREAYPDRRLVAVFQPHLYSRTRAFTPEFARALAGADLALVLPIFPSREDPIPGVTADRIVEAAPEEASNRIRRAGPEDVVDPAVAAAGDDDRPAVVVFMGAGDVTELAHELAARLEGGSP